MAGLSVPVVCLSTDHEYSVGRVVRSFATEIHRRSQSATVNFQNLSHYIQAVHAGQTRSILLPKSSGSQPAHPQIRGT
ncbi:hypothetical protein RAB80_013967 [Fusarium oxysporum f. sp. vasinfectum]|nr:hypothetical protein RAB80_013967 [Fusarium oxysporum f. sp. vasinfectum]